jgi:hypothetical protein
VGATPTQLFIECPREGRHFGEVTGELHNASIMRDCYYPVIICLWWR